MKKKWKNIAVNQQELENLKKEIYLPTIFQRLLIQRGIKTAEAAGRFFNPKLSHLHDPFLMKDIEKAARRLKQAIDREEKILLYGDYDVDGTCAVATLFSFLSQQTKNLNYYIPNRFTEGYGLSLQGIAHAQKTETKLLICLDCGIHAHQPIQLARQSGIDVIVCDHHLPGEDLPGAYAVLNPKRGDCPYPFKELSGCGVGYKLVHAYANLAGLPDESWKALLDLVAVSTACDILPLTGENRVLAHFGLQKLNGGSRPGLKALIRQSSRPFPLDISDLVFYIGPMINAAGRLGDAKEAVRLLLTSDKFVAGDYARRLHAHNQRRKSLDKKAFLEAQQNIKSDPGFDQKKSIVLFNETWHQGVAGIVASRIAEKYFKPTLILTESNGALVGSGRSVGSFDLFGALSQCASSLKSFGGHKFAAGLSLEPENLPDLQARFEKAVSQTLTPGQIQPVIKVAGEISLAEISPSFLHTLRKFAPFGPGNPNPVFISRDVYDSGLSKKLKGNHMKLVIRQGDSDPFVGLAFNRGKQFSVVKEAVFDICYSIKESKWEGNRGVAELHIKDIQGVPLKG